MPCVFKNSRLNKLLNWIELKSGGKSGFSLPFLSDTVNDVKRNFYTVGIQSTVGKQAKRMPDTLLTVVFF